MKFSALDLLAMQECLESYKKLVEWLVAIDRDEEELKRERLSIILHLQNKCEAILREEKNEQSDN